MIQTLKLNLSGLVKKQNSVYISFLLSLGALSATAQQTYTFTSANATGRLGPTQAQLIAAYNPTLSSIVTSAAGIQTMVIPNSGMYRIEAWGASGGTTQNLSGYGARVLAEVYLTAGNTLKVLVGQMGSLYATTYSDGGGGGSFVSENSNLLVAAGGGGGTAQNSSPSQNASLLQTVANALPSTFGSQGAGATVNGVNMTYGVYTPVAQAFVNGGAGQAGGQAGGWPGTNYGDGGFGGGGGACSCSTGGGGGGGGYNGGGGGGSAYNSGTGGSSYFMPSAVNTAITQLTTFGNGKVIVTALCNVSLTTPLNPICIGNSITLSTDAVSGITWSSGSTANSIVVSPTTTTTYSVSGTSTANCVSGTLLTVTVNPLPVISTVVSPTTLCVGNTATITASGANTYTWSNGTLVVPTTTVSPVVTTAYNIIAKSVFGCINSRTVAVNVNTNSLTVSPATTICEGSSANLTASGGVTYTWSNGSMFPAIPVTPTTNTTYFISARDAFNCLLTNFVPVTLATLPPVSVSANKQTFCKGDNVTLTASGAASYTWSTGNVGPTVNYALPVDVSYNYSVKGADLNTCTKTVSITITALKCLGINQVSASGVGITVMPNPGNGLFNVQISNTTTSLNVKIYNTLGMLVRTQEVTSGNNLIDIQNEKSGIYFMYMNNGDTNTGNVIKLIKE